MTAPARECQPVGEPLRQRLTPLENVLGVMKSARSKNNVMEVWADDLKAMEDAVSEAALLKSRVEELTKALEEIALGNQALARGIACEALRAVVVPLEGRGGAT